MTAGTTWDERKLVAGVALDITEVEECYGLNAKDGAGEVEGKGDENRQAGTDP